MSERRAWSVITVERLKEYADQAERLGDFAARERIHPFAAALAGVAFVHNAIKVMGGSVDWWIELLRDPNAIRKYMIGGADGLPVPPPPGKQ